MRAGMATARFAAIYRAVADCIDDGAAAPRELSLDCGVVTITLDRPTRTQRELDQQIHSWLPKLRRVQDRGWEYGREQEIWFRLVYADLPLDEEETGYTRVVLVAETEAGDE